jgi:hypothetical protein
MTEKTGADFFLETNPSDELLEATIKSTQVHGLKLIAERDRRAGYTTHSSGSLDPECICFGNWRLIVKETEHRLDKLYFEERTGHHYVFAGILHGSDDYYYAMSSRTHGLRLLSCVGSIEQSGFKPIEDQELPPSYQQLLDENEALKAELAELKTKKLCSCPPPGMETVPPGECIKCGGSNTGPCTVAVGGNK